MKVKTISKRDTNRIAKHLEAIKEIIEQNRVGWGYEIGYNADAKSYCSDMLHIPWELIEVDKCTMMGE